MSAELFFIYDSHCPWSMASTRLVNEIHSKMPEITLHLWHCARYEGDEHISRSAVTAMTEESGIRVADEYITQLKSSVDSTVAANLMSWLCTKQPQNALPVLNAIQQALFNEGNPMQSKADFQNIIDSFKLSPPAKVFNADKLMKDAEYALSDIHEIQEVIGTRATPAILLAIDEELVLLNHNLYLKAPEAIVDAIKLELK